MLMLLEGVSGYMRLAPAKACTARFYGQTARDAMRSVGDAEDPGGSQRAHFETGSFGDRPRRPGPNIGSVWRTPVDKHHGRGSDAGGS